MRFREIAGGGVIVLLDPGTCLLLANACFYSADAYSDDKREELAAQYDTLRALLEAWAVLGAAGGEIKTRHYPELTLDAVAKGWGTFDLTPTLPARE